MGAKSFCRIAKSMTEAATTARTLALELMRRECRGNGDNVNAMRRLEARYGIPWRTFWALKYRPPTDILVSVYERLTSAYQAECDRQLRLLRHEIEITKLKVGADCPAVRTAEALVAKAERETP